MWTNELAESVALASNDLGQLRKYRVGDYCIIADIQDERVQIFVVRVGARKDIYR